MFWKILKKKLYCMGGGVDISSKVWIAEVFEGDNDELFATMVQTDLGGDTNKLTHDLMIMIRPSYNKSIEEYPNIVYSGIKSFPKLYYQMFL